MLEPNGENVEMVLDSAFQEFGLPKAIRSDNDPPFASTGAGRLAALSVWWLKLGIRLERIEPGKPQQNGRLERCHLTLEEAVNPPARNLVEQRRVVDARRGDYNEVRPGRGLRLAVPPHLHGVRAGLRIDRRRPDGPSRMRFQLLRRTELGCRKGFSVR